jgi:hypothetical protein
LVNEMNMKSRKLNLFDKYLLTFSSIILGVLAGALVMGVVVYFGKYQNPNSVSPIIGVFIIHGLMLISSVVSGIVTIINQRWIGILEHNSEYGLLVTCLWFGVMVYIVKWPFLKLTLPYTLADILIIFAVYLLSKRKFRRIPSS